MNHISNATVLAAAVAVAIAIPALAQQAAPMPGMAMPAQAGAAPNADASMMPAMDKMSRDMAAVPMTGDADRDFAGMMVPHHQGAIAMARYELAHGKDPQMLKLARAVVGAQAKEITQMNTWLTTHPAHQ